MSVTNNTKRTFKNLKKMDLNPSFLKGRLFEKDFLDKNYPIFRELAEFLGYMDSDEIVRQALVFHFKATGLDDEDAYIRAYYETELKKLDSKFIQEITFIFFLKAIDIEPEGSLDSLKHQVLKILTNMKRYSFLIDKSRVLNNNVN
ncbi:MAG: hypothetical protein ACTSVW_05880 [Candidatus Njordarchaeales archaeon]